MENLNVTVLTGGRYHCTPSWSKVTGKSDNCYKFYFVTAGDAMLRLSGQWYPLMGGHAYFINGYELEQQQCSQSMDLYWLHIVTHSQILNLFLKTLQPIHSWRMETALFSSLDLEQLTQLFIEPESDHSVPRESIDLSLQCLVHGLIQLLIADMSRNQGAPEMPVSQVILQKLQPSLDYIHAHYCEKIPLDQIAHQTFLSKAYFLRLFKSCFQQTPYQYILQLRLNEAARLLSRTNQPIRQISDSLGFNTQFHLTKVFKSYYHCTPSDYRNKRMLP